MPDSLSWAETVRIVHTRADYCCEYCRTCQKVCGQAMHVEHIIPSEGNSLTNLALSCASCNLSKAKAITAQDPVSEANVALFNPRVDTWKEHFEWVEDGALIVGKTPIGRATIERLKMNIERVVTSRKIWIKAGEHPPK